MSGLLCLKWNNHSSTFYKTLNNHRNKELYCDSTIVCRGKYYPVHRLVLSTCSEYFEEIFERTECKHPFIIIKDILPIEIEALLNYMYKGEVNVLQEMLPGLIRAAEALKIKGLAVPDDDEVSNEVTAKDMKRSQTDSSSPYPQAKKSKKSDKKSRGSTSPSQRIEVEPEIIPIEANTRLSETTSGHNLDKNNRVNEVQKDSSSSTFALDVIRNSPSKFSHQDSSSASAASKNSLANDKDDSCGENEDEDMEDVKVEPLEIGDNTEENSYSLSEQDLESKSDPEGSLFQTLLGGDGPSISDKKAQQSSDNQVAQCSSWDDNMDPSNDNSHLNADGTQDEMHKVRRRTRRIYQDEDGDSSDILIQEIFSERQQGENEEEEEDNSDLEHCHYCSYTSRYKTNMRTHVLRKHTSELAFSCTLCEYRCSTKESLKVHTRKHTGEKPYKCKICPYRAAHYASIKKHMMVHTGEKPFKCPKCSYSAIQKNPLLKHMKLHEYDQNIDFSIFSPTYDISSP